MTDNNSLRERLARVFWLGGGSGGAKSTIARRLAAEHGLRLYDTDAAMADHNRRLTAEDAPLLAAFKAQDMDARWVNRSPEVMLESFHWFAGEGFGLIVDDLLALPLDQGVIAEGFRLLPALVAPLLARPSQAAWLIPTPEFRLTAFTARDGLWSIAGRTGDPERALANLLKRDAMFTDRIEREANEAGLAVIKVDGSATEDELADRVARQFGL